MPCCRTACWCCPTRWRLPPRVTIRAASACGSQSGASSTRCMPAVRSAPTRSAAGCAPTRPGSDARSSACSPAATCGAGRTRGTGAGSCSASPRRASARTRRSPSRRGGGTRTCSARFRARSARPSSACSPSCSSAPARCSARRIWDSASDAGPSRIERVLRLTAVTQRFGARTVLNAISLDVAAGEYVAVVGDSGIGKSTLLNVIAGLEPVHEGTVQFEGKDLTAMDDDALTVLRREKFGFVFQAFHILPNLTVEQNVNLPLLLRRIQDGEKVRSCIASVGLGGREASLPRELSGGELQRVAIARALVGEPKLVLADEPTENLDPENAKSVLSLFREETKK